MNVQSTVSGASVKPDSRAARSLEIDVTSRFGPPWALGNYTWGIEPDWMTLAFLPATTEGCVVWTFDSVGSSLPWCWARSYLFPPTIACASSWLLELTDHVFPNAQAG